MPSLARSSGEAETRMIIPEVVLLVFWQIISVVSPALVAQSVFPLDIEQENHGAEHTKPYEAETQPISKSIRWCLACQEHVAGKWSVTSLKRLSEQLTKRLCRHSSRIRPLQYC